MFNFTCGKNTRDENTYPDHVVNRVHITVTHVNSDGSQRKAEPLPRAVDDDWRPEAADADGEVPAGGRVSG